jgi:hypothetical protein
VSFFNNDLSGSPCFINFSVIAVTHDNVAVADGMNFVNSFFITDLIKSGEEFRKKRNDFSLVLNVVTKLGEANHVSE